MKRQIIIGHFLTLSMGVLVYISFRQDTLKMFDWFDRVALSELVSRLRRFTLPMADFLPNWFLYSVPDGLWLFSYLSILLVFGIIKFQSTMFIGCYQCRQLQSFLKSGNCSGSFQELLMYSICYFTWREQFSQFYFSRI